MAELDSQKLRPVSLHSSTFICHPLPIEGFRRWLDDLKLDGYAKQALVWAEEMGASDLEEVLENLEDFMEKIGLGEKLATFRKKEGLGTKVRHFGEWVVVVFWMLLDLAQNGCVFHLCSIIHVLSCLSPKPSLPHFGAMRHVTGAHALFGPPDVWPLASDRARFGGHFFGWVSMFLAHESYLSGHTFRLWVHHPIV